MTQPALKQRLLTVAEYHTMARAGILTEDDRVELIDGKIVEMTPIGGAHIHCVNRLTHLLVEAIGEQARVSVQNPVRLGPRTEPQPDLALLRGKSQPNEVPRANDVLLLIEVADTSLEYDREEKLPRYAEAGIPEVWIVVLSEDEGHEQGVEVYRDPAGDTYETTHRAHRGDTVRTALLAEMDPLAVHDILG